jgi:hypothetical protein
MIKGILSKEGYLSMPVKSNQHFYKMAVAYCLRNSMKYRTILKILTISAHAKSTAKML